MEDTWLLIILAFLTFLLLVALFFFGNKIFGFTTGHRELFRRKDYFSKQQQLLISNQYHLYCINCKKAPRKFLSTSVQTEEVPVNLTQPSEKLLRKQLSSPEDNIELSATQLSSHDNNLSRKFLTHTSCNYCIGQLCVQKNDT